MVKIALELADDKMLDKLQPTDSSVREVVSGQMMSWLLHLKIIKG